MKTTAVADICGAGRVEPREVASILELVLLTVVDPTSASGYALGNSTYNAMHSTHNAET